MTRLTITSGSPTTEEIAVIAAVVHGLATATAAAAPRRIDPAWTQAARLEGMGQAPLVSAADARLVTPDTTSALWLPRQPLPSR